MTALARPPTGEAGSVRPELADLKGDLPPADARVDALRWPSALDTYAAMLDDPRIWALVQAVALPSQRYIVELEPNGLTPADAEMLADDLDLPIAGVDQQVDGRDPTRFSHRRHFARCLTALNIGHAVFEIVGQLLDGRWRLVDLAPRPARSLTRWECDRQGRLTVIEQGGAGRPIPLRADRLAVYTWGGDAGDPRGESMLNKVHRPFILKDRFTRLDLVGHERNSMGIPVGWVSDDATAEHAARLDALLADMAAGERTFLRLQRGQDFRLRGVEGTTSRPLDSIVFQNGEMEVAFFAQVLSLGQGASGSRALGETQLGMLELFWEVVVQWACDTLTREVVARWCRWNLGVDGPVARVVWRERGAEAKTDTFAYYLEYQLLTIDEARARIGLEPLPDGQGERFPESAEVLARIEDRGVTPTAAALNAARERHGLSRMTEMQIVRASGAPEGRAPVEATGRRARPTTPRPARARRPVAASSVPVPDRDLRRQPTELEAAAGVDFAQIDQQWTGVQETVTELLAAGRADLADRALDALRDLDQVDPLTLADILAPILRAAADDHDPGPIADALQDAARDGVDQVIAEADRQGRALRPDALDFGDRAELEARDALRQLAASLTETIVNATKTSIEPGAAGATVADAASAAIDRLTDAQPDLAASGMTSRALNAGRGHALATGDYAELAGSSLLDTGTCDPCIDWDGRTFDTLDEALEQYPGGGGNKDCEGGSRCRCVLVGVLATEQERAT